VGQQTSWRWISPSPWSGQQSSVRGSSTSEGGIDIATRTAQTTAGNLIRGLRVVTTALLQTGASDDQKGTPTGAHGRGIVEGTGSRIGGKDTIVIGHIARGALELGEFAEDSPKAKHIAKDVLNLNRK